MTIGTARRTRRSAARSRLAAIAAAATVLVALTGCGPSPLERSIASCLPGTWRLQTDEAAAGVTAEFGEHGLPIDVVGMNGTQTLVVTKGLRAQVSADITVTADGHTRDGRDLVLVQTVTGVRAATVDLDGAIVRFESVTGMLDEDLAARVDGRQTGRHYRMPSTAIIGRPGSLACTKDSLTLQRLHGVTLRFTRG